MDAQPTDKSLMYQNIKDNTAREIKTQLVELIAPANTANTSFSFDTQNFLRMKQIIGIEVLTVNDVTTSPLGNAVITNAIYKASYLSLYGSDPEQPDNKGVWMQDIPFPSMHRISNGTDSFVYDAFTMVPRNIVWEKSRITTKLSTLGNTSPISYLLRVTYLGTLGD